MRIDEVFPSKFLKAADIKGKKIKVQIANWAMEEVGDGKKPVLYFAGKDKGLVLNKTNAQMIASVYGPELDDWVNCSIHLYTAKVTNREGQVVDGLKVEVVPEVVNEDSEPSF